MLERYVLHQSTELELDTIETHVLACESCVARLEDLEAYIGILRQAHQELQLEEAKQPAKESLAAKISSWFTPQRMGLAAAMAVVAIAVSITPYFTSSHGNGTPIQANLSTWRGVETHTLQAGRPLDVHLNAADLPKGAAWAQLVDSDGRELWKGSTSIVRDSAEVRLPALEASQSYFLRLYSPAAAGAGQGDLLREFAFRTK